MFSLKATALFALPVLASASDIISTRVQRRHQLLELLQHNHDKRQANEQYNEQNVCTVAPGANQATFSDIDNANVGKNLAGPLRSFNYDDAASAACLTRGKCQAACIVDAAQCVAMSFNDADPTALSCTLYGFGYSGLSISVVPLNFQLLSNAGTTSPSTGGVPAEAVSTCATKGQGLDEADPNTVGGCVCGPGRFPDTAYTCKANALPQSYFSPSKPPVTLKEPVKVSSPIVWTAAIQAVPAVMTNRQCAAICADDSANCKAYLYRAGSELSSCWKIGFPGASAEYNNDASFPIVIDSATGKVKRQSGGQTGSVGQSGDVFGQPAGSPIVTDLPSNPQASQVAGLRKRARRSSSQVQW